MKQSREQLEAIFQAALDIETNDQRAAYLDRACPDAEVRREVESLLDAHCHPDTLFSGETRGSSKNAEGPPEKAGTVIGRYKLLQKIGEGGCGVVYMAEQEEPVRRRVALKIIKLGMDTKSVIARFEAERQALALMDHPNIAKVFDAGSTERPLTPSLSPDGGEGARRAGEGEAAQSQIANRESEIRSGRPYFVMELVRGVKITDYCDGKNLSTKERLDLFVKVCQAIQHAHQKGIIHRDIKPSNILVTVNDGIAVPKVIDFGIAKATADVRLTDKTVFTAFEQFIGTPAYMSPEQAEITSVDVDTRSDIYSLGVLLYELLTGKTPFDAKELLKAGLDEMRRTIREKEPDRPSTKVSTLGGEELTSTAKRRGLEPPKLVNVLRGDLDWIVMKCLEKDRSRRYETANGLASDIQRHLNNEPVVACPPSNLYRFQKLVRRNKLAFAAGTGIAAALLIGLTISLWQSIEKSRAYSRAIAAEQEAKSARATETQARQQAEEARARAEANEKKAQTAAAQSRQVAQFLGEIFHGLAPTVALGRDTTLLKAILDNAAQRIGTELTNQPEVELELRCNLAESYNELGLYKEEAEMARGCLELARANFPEESAQVAEGLFQVSMALNSLGQLKEAEVLARDSVSIRRKLFAAAQASTNFPSDSLYLTERFAPSSLYDSLSELGHVFYNQGEADKAEAAYRESLALARRVRGDVHEHVARELSGLGMSLWWKNEHSKAEEALREAVAIHRELHGTNAHPSLASVINNLALILQDQSKLDAAKPLFIEALEMTKKMVGVDSREVAIDYFNLASLARAQNQLEDAERRLREAIPIMKRLGNDDKFLAQALGFLGEVLIEQRKLDDAYEAVSESLALRRRVLGNDSVEVAYNLMLLTSILVRQERMAEAEPLCRESLAIYEAKTPEGWRAFETRSLLGTTLLGQKKYSDAEPLLLSGYEGLKQRQQQVPKTIKAEMKQAVRDLVRLYEATSRPERAAEWKATLTALDGQLTDEHLESGKSSAK